MLTTAPLSISQLDPASHEVDPLSGKRLEPEARRPVASQPLCSECRRRPAITCIHGRRVVSEDHDMCRQCWRSRMDARKAATRQARRFRRF
jgi:hypothetical protein